MRRLLCLLPLLAVGACNAVLGIGDASLDLEADGAAGGTSINGGSSPKADQACTGEGTLVCGAPAAGPRAEAVLFCEAGHYKQVFACPGLQSCIDSASFSSVACGSADVSLTYAISEAPCGAEGAAACSFDAGVLLQCEAGKWIESRHCEPSRCVAKTEGGQRGLRCENGGYSEGDRCGFAAGSVVCSTDLSAILICDGGTATVKEACQAPKQCTLLSGGALGCG